MKRRHRRITPVRTNRHDSAHPVGGNEHKSVRRDEGTNARGSVGGWCTWRATSLNAHVGPWNCSSRYNDPSSDIFTRGVTCDVSNVAYDFSMIFSKDAVGISSSLMNLVMIFAASCEGVRKRNVQSKRSAGHDLRRKQSMCGLNVTCKAHGFRDNVSRLLDFYRQLPQ